MIIGGVAVIAHGVRRLTTDVDAVIRGDRVDITTLLRSLSRSKIVPRIEHAERFARENLVLLLRHAPSGVDLDVSLGWTSFELEALTVCKSVRFGSVSAPMAGPTDLVIFKALAGRPKDVDDTLTLLFGEIGCKNEKEAGTEGLNPGRRRLRGLYGTADSAENGEGSSVRTFFFVGGASTPGVVEAASLPT